MHHYCINNIIIFIITTFINICNQKIVIYYLTFFESKVVWTRHNSWRGLIYTLKLRINSSGFRRKIRYYLICHEMNMTVSWSTSHLGQNSYWVSFNEGNDGLDLLELWYCSGKHSNWIIEQALKFDQFTVDNGGEIWLEKFCINLIYICTYFWKYSTFSNI